MIRLKRTVYAIAAAVCAVVFVFSSYLLISRISEGRKSGGQFSSLQELKDSSESAVSASGTESRVPKYHLNIYEQNNDTIGWISIPDTKIDYPVMQTEDPYDYYLKRSFTKEANDWGTPFVGLGCDAALPSDNIIIYGHHMKDGSMFSDLVKYESKSYYDTHSRIYFDTLYEKGQWEIVYAVKTVVYTDNDPFKFWTYTSLEHDDDYNEFIEMAEKYKLYNTGVKVEKGDRFITLVTCEYSNKNGRMVIIAKKVK